MTRDLAQAVTSMLSNLSKHEGTAPVVADGFMFTMAFVSNAFHDEREARRFIEGFN